MPSSNTSSVWEIIKDIATPEERMHIEDCAISGNSEEVYHAAIELCVNNASLSAKLFPDSDRLTEAQVVSDITDGISNDYNDVAKSDEDKHSVEVILGKEQTSIDNTENNIDLQNVTVKDLETAKIKEFSLSKEIETKQGDLAVKEKAVETEKGVLENTRVTKADIESKHISHKDVSAIENKIKDISKSLGSGTEKFKPADKGATIENRVAVMRDYLDKTSDKYYSDKFDEIRIAIKDVDPKFQADSIVYYKGRETECEKKIKTLEGEIDSLNTEIDELKTEADEAHKERVAVHEEFWNQHDTKNDVDKGTEKTDTGTEKVNPEKVSAELDKKGVEYTKEKLDKYIDTLNGIVKGVEVTKEGFVSKYGKTDGEAKYEAFRNDIYATLGNKDMSAQEKIAAVKDIATKAFEAESKKEVVLKDFFAKLDRGDTTAAQAILADKDSGKFLKEYLTTDARDKIDDKSAGKIISDLSKADKKEFTEKVGGHFSKEDISGKSHDYTEKAKECKEKADQFVNYRSDTFRSFYELRAAKFEMQAATGDAKGAAVANYVGKLVGFLRSNIFETIILEIIKDVVDKSTVETSKADLEKLTNEWGKDVESGATDKGDDKDSSGSIIKDETKGNVDDSNTSVDNENNENNTSDNTDNEDDFFKDFENTESDNPDDVSKNKTEEDNAGPEVETPESDKPDNDREKEENERRVEAAVDEEARVDQHDNDSADKEQKPDTEKEDPDKTDKDQDKEEKDSTDKEEKDDSEKDENKSDTEQNEKDNDTHDDSGAVETEETNNGVDNPEESTDVDVTDSTDDVETADSTDDVETESSDVDEGNTSDNPVSTADTDDDADAMYQDPPEVEDDDSEESIDVDTAVNAGEPTEENHNDEDKSVDTDPDSDEISTDDDFEFFDLDLTPDDALNMIETTINDAGGFDNLSDGDKEYVLDTYQDFVGNDPSEIGDASFQEAFNERLETQAGDDISIPDESPIDSTLGVDASNENFDNIDNAATDVINDVETTVSDVVNDVTNDTPDQVETNYNDTDTSSNDNATAPDETPSDVSTPDTMPEVEVATGIESAVDAEGADAVVALL